MINRSTKPIFMGFNNIVNINYFESIIYALVLISIKLFCAMDKNSEEFSFFGPKTRSSYRVEDFKHFQTYVTINHVSIMWIVVK